VISLVPALIVPTLRVVTPPPTLCVPRTTHIQAGEVTRSVTGCIPTLRVVTPPQTLRVPRTTHIQAGEVTRSVTGCIPTQSEGTIKAIKINSFPAEAGPTR